jgi:drug/metabolite transporter (DMT)-like permease
MGSRDHRQMPEALIPPSLAVVALGLLASVGWGVADFGGGLTSKASPVLGVLGGSQAIGLLVGIPLFLALDEPAMQTRDMLISIGGGILGAVGLALLYRGLSVGRMGVVAPVAAVLTSAVPVAYGFLTQGMPSGLAVVGIALAVAGVTLVSRVPGGDDGRPSGLWYAVAAGVTFGIFTVGASFLADDLILGPVVTIRITSVVAIAGFLLIRRTPWRVPRRSWPALLFIGVADMAATATYLTAIQIGPLAIAAIMASMYPIVTTLLATVVLRERVTRTHAAGIVAATLAVVLIAGAPGG